MCSYEFIMHHEIFFINVGYFQALLSLYELLIKVAETLWMLPYNQTILSSLLYSERFS